MKEKSAVGSPALDCSQEESIAIGGRADLPLGLSLTCPKGTGLANRAPTDERIAQAIERARRNLSMVAVLLVDLDRFKLANQATYQVQIPGRQNGNDGRRSFAA